MYTVNRSGSVVAAIRSVRDVPGRVIPYAASTALTKTAQAAQRAIVAEMPRVFDRPTSYTLNALRVVPSTVQTLEARVAVNDIAGGLPQEAYLLPEVAGGRRNEKRFERSLRYSGFLRAGERAVPGSAAPLDAAGNLSAATLRGIMRRLQALGQQPRGRRVRDGYFVGAAGRRATRGVWLREGRSLRPVLIFTPKQPQYRQRLDFVGIAERAARDVFPREFEAAAAAIQARNR